MKSDTGKVKGDISKTKGDADKTKGDTVKTKSDTVKTKNDTSKKSERTVAKTAVEKLAKANLEEESEQPVDENEVVLDVECGANKARLHLSKLCQGSKGPCIYFNKAWLTPNEFQYVSGRETAKDWKRSIRHFGKSIKLLMSKETMKVDPPLCECEGCTGISVSCLLFFKKHFSPVRCRNS